LDVADVAEPLLQILAQAAREQLAQARRRPGGQPIVLDLTLDDRREDLGHVLACERGVTREHFVQQAPERPDVGLPVDRPPFRLLGRHVGGRAEDDALLRRRQAECRRLREAGRRARRLALERFGEAEVEHLHAPLGRHLHVRRLEVAVDDALLVRRVERAGDLDRDRERLVDRQRPLRDPLGERLAFDQFEDEEPRAVRSRRGRGSWRCADD
jgi:hypothetical protein